MNQLEPTYLRYVYDGLSKGSISSNNPTSLPIGFIGLFEDEFPSSMPLVERMSILNRLAIWALLKGPVSIEMVAEVLNEHPDNTKALVDTYSKWFNSPEPGKYILYHDRLRTYLLQKLCNHEVQNLNETLISYLENALNSEGLKESESYALEHLSTHMLIESQMGNNYERLHEFVNQEDLWKRQITKSNEYKWSLTAVQNAISESARRNIEINALEASVNSVKLMEQEEGGVEATLNFLDNGDYIISLKRVQNWGLQRKLNILLLMLYDLTIGHLNIKSFKKEACLAIIEELKKVDHTEVSNNLFSTISIYTIYLELKKIEVDISFLWKNIDNDFTEVFQLANSFDLEIQNFELKKHNEQLKIKESEILIKKYKQKKLKNVRNSKKLNSLEKEIEFQELEIQVAEKKIKEHISQLDKISLTNSFKKYISKLDYDDIIDVIHLSSKPKDYIVFITHFFNCIDQNYINQKKEVIIDGIPGESIVDSLVDSIKLKYQIREGFIPDPIQEIVDRSYIDMLINEISNTLKTKFNLDQNLLFSSAVNDNSKALTEKIFELKGNIFDKLKSISRSKKVNESDYIKLIKTYFNKINHIDSIFSSKNSKILQNNVLTTIKHMVDSANVVDNSILALYNYYALISFRFSNLLKSKEIIIIGLDVINPIIEKHKKSFFLEMKKKTAEEQTALILSLDKSYSIEEVNNYLNGKIGGLYSENNIVKKYWLLESIGNLTKLIYSFQKNYSGNIGFEDFTDEIFNLIYRIVNIINEVFYYNDLYNMHDELIYEIHDKINPILKTGQKLEMSLDFKFYLILKYIEFDDFFNSLVNDSKKSFQYSSLPQSISDSIPQMFSDSQEKYLKLGSLIIEKKIFLKDDQLELLIDHYLADNKISEAYELFEFINSKSQTTYFKILKFEYPNIIPTNEIFRILKWIGENYHVFVGYQTNSIDNLILLFSKTDSLRAKKITYNIILDQLELLDYISFLNNLNRLINNTLFRSKVELLNELLIEKTKQFYKTGDGEKIITSYMAIKKSDNLNEIQRNKILNIALGEITIQGYNSISTHLYKIFENTISTSSTPIKFDDVSFFADIFIQLSFNDKLVIENSDKTNGTFKIVDSYYNFYKVFENLSIAYNINWDLTGYFYSCFYSKIIELNNVIEILVFDKLLIHNFIDNKFIIGNIDHDYEFLDDLSGSNFITQSSINFEEMPGLFFIYLRESLIDSQDNYLYKYSILFEYAILYNLNNRFDLSLKCIDLMPKRYKDLTLYYLCKNFTDEKIFLKLVKLIRSAYFKILAYIDVFSLNFNLNTAKIPNNFNDLLDLIKGHYNETEKQSLFLNFYNSMLDNSMKKEHKILESIIKKNYGDKLFIKSSDLINNNSEKDIETLFEELKNYDLLYEGLNGGPLAESSIFNYLDSAEMSTYKKAIHLIYNSNDTEKKKYLNSEINKLKYICGYELSNNDDYEKELTDVALANVFLIRSLKYFYLAENSKSIALLNRGFRLIGVEN